MDNALSHSQDLPEFIAAGGRLSVVLEPDPGAPALGQPLPRYVETYPLPHLVVEDGQVWGATRRTHLVHKDGVGLGYVIGFFYTPSVPLYGLYTYEDEMLAMTQQVLTVRVMSAKQYDVIKFERLPPGPKVWSMDAPDSAETLDASIRAGNGHYVVFRDTDGTTRSHPLDLAFLFMETGDVRISTEQVVLPEPFRSPRAFLDRMRGSLPGFDDGIQNPKFVKEIKSLAYQGFRRIDGSGVSYNPAELLSQKPGRCEAIAIYATP